MSLGLLAATARAERVSYNCVSKLIAQFQQNAQLTTRNRENGRPAAIPYWMEAYIEALILIYPTLHTQRRLEGLPTMLCVSNYIIDFFVTFVIVFKSSNRKH
jgi:hypothetical protein